MKRIALHRIRPERREFLRWLLGQAATQRNPNRA
jgi:hypothetical protein